MKLTHKSLGYEYTVEIETAEFGHLRLATSEVASGIVGHAVLDQVTALSLARLIEEQVKDMRRK